ncbi:mRNA-processing factor 17 [Seminavis robusta]|uniref:Pre-mRNA-processing factor 17 n=1 Tax=Seminavis robusta TaxID=568900 RepID=A0A9N8DBP9_9STRA|nr:mRNA-processing factor 17 [Seminavis robusta]|eukprot:Sro9_g007550.1 mRNA-processing factor 17 (629) ;mRNA; r:182528-184523
MDLLGGYDSSNSEGDEPKLKPDVKAIARPADRRFLQAAPSVSAITAGRGLNQGSTATSLTVYGGGASSGTTGTGSTQKSNQGALVLMNNPTKSSLYAPVYGPLVDPNASNNKQGHGNHETNVAFEEATFQEQRNKFQRTGRAAAPDAEGSEVVRTTLGYSKHRLQEFAKVDEQRRKRQRPSNDKKEPLVHGSDDEVEHGIWAPPTTEERWAADNSLSDIARGGVESLAPEQLAEREYLKERDRQLGKQEEEKESESAVDRLVERKMAHLLPPKLASDDQIMEATTQFHAKQEFDYKGQSWMAPPAGLANIANSEEDLDMDHHKCFVPKKCVHRFQAGSKGVHRIRLFPKTGHLVLSAGLDGVCKVWSIPQKQLMRSYSGHSAAVRDVQFNHTGSRFVSASFDRYLRLWNTESGEVLQTLTNRKVPYVVKFFPLDDNLFVVGCSDNKIVTYDCTTGEITQEYNHHLAPVNAIVFSEDKGMKMITSSDDKKLLVWEWDTPVPIKYISDPSMHSIPCLTMHPSQQYFCGQSLDNHIAVFQASNRFALQRKKKFSGHLVAGYACEMDISPDGQFLVSGDGNGKLCFWDWKRTRMMQKYRAHDKGPAICVAWHPLDPSVVFSCGWDGVIKMWE